MTRKTYVQINQENIAHNLSVVKRLAPNSQIIAMVKANAYGCGLTQVIPVLDGQVDAVGVACLNEALFIRQLGYEIPVILFQGVFSTSEFPVIDQYQFDLVIHCQAQLDAFLAYPFTNRISCWVKVDTGLHRLGFAPEEVDGVVKRLNQSNQVNRPIGIMSHFACADVPTHPLNQVQLDRFEAIHHQFGPDFIYSLSNSGSIVTLPKAHYDMVRPGIMLYGSSPISGKLAHQLDLKTVSSFFSQIMAIKSISAGESVGYGLTWQSKRASRIAVISVGYGDGYPRHISAEAYVVVKRQKAPIVGTISMDMMVIDITDCQDIKIGDRVEMWGEHVPIEQVATWAGTISYELFCQFHPRVKLSRPH